MSKVFDKPIEIQTQDELTELWTTKFKVHASINKAKSNSEYLKAGAIQCKVARIFEVRYFKDLEDIAFNNQKYRILFQGVPYDIEDYDDYMLEHKTIKLLGVSY